MILNTAEELEWKALASEPSTEALGAKTHYHDAFWALIHVGALTIDNEVPPNCDQKRIFRLAAVILSSVDSWLIVDAHFFAS